MIIKNLLKVKIHPLFYFVALLASITGLFNEFIVFTTIILIHEMGHVITGIFFHLTIKKIVILPFGGLTIFEMPINTRLYKEFIVAIMGPIFQMIFWFILYHFNNYNPLFNYYNIFLLIFNLLPISPLDGSKIFNIIMNKITSFKNSYFITIYVSIITIVLFIYVILFKKYNLSLVIIILFLIKQVIKEYYNYPYIFNKFLFERYKKNFYFSKTRIIKNIKDMKKDYKHLFKEKNKYMEEKEILRKRFDFEEKQ